jgi:hypothetical protein
MAAFEALWGKRVRLGLHERQSDGLTYMMSLGDPVDGTLTVADHGFVVDGVAFDIEAPAFEPSSGWQDGSLWIRLGARAVVLTPLPI